MDVCVLRQPQPAMSTPRPFRVIIGPEANPDLSTLPWAVTQTMKMNRLVENHDWRLCI
jgi:hypothetical protein